MNPRLRTLFPRGSQSFFKANETETDHQLRSAKPQSNAAMALDKTATREEKGMERVILRFKGCFVQPRDPDRFAGSLTGIIDGLRHAHLIRNDDFWSVRLECEQERVKSFAEERVELEIEWPEEKT